LTAIRRSSASRRCTRGCWCSRVSDGLRAGRACRWRLLGLVVCVATGRTDPCLALKCLPICCPKLRRDLQAMGMGLIDGASVSVVSDG
jgi:hypothetical protein